MSTHAELRLTWVPLPTVVREGNVRDIEVVAAVAYNPGVVAVHRAPGVCHIVRGREVLKRPVDPHTSYTLVDQQASHILVTVPPATTVSIAASGRGDYFVESCGGLTFDIRKGILVSAGRVTSLRGIAQNYARVSVAELVGEAAELELHGAACVTVHAGVVERLIASARGDVRLDFHAFAASAKVTTHGLAQVFLRHVGTLHPVGDGITVLQHD